jgi:hypothetical protein
MQNVRETGLAVSAASDMQYKDLNKIKLSIKRPSISKRSQTTVFERNPEKISQEDMPGEILKDVSSDV